jgi:hypothetical protein
MIRIGALTWMTLLLALPHFLAKLPDGTPPNSGPPGARATAHSGDSRGARLPLPRTDPSGASYRNTTDPRNRQSNSWEIFPQFLPHYAEGGHSLQREDDRNIVGFAWRQAEILAEQTLDRAETPIYRLNPGTNWTGICKTDEGGCPLASPPPTPYPLSSKPS